MIPRFFASPYGGVIAERFERIHVMISADLIRFVLMGSLTIAAIADSPAWAVIALAAGCSVAACVYDPSMAAITPQMLGEGDLAAGNALNEIINNVAPDLPSARSCSHSAAHRSSSASTRRRS